MSNMINYPISCVFFANNNKTSTEATTLLLFRDCLIYNIRFYHLHSKTKELN